MTPVEFRGRYSRKHLLKIASVSRRVFGGEPVYSGVGCFGLIALTAIVQSIIVLVHRQFEESWMWIGGALIASAITAWHWRSLRRAFATGSEVEIHGSIGEDGYHIVTPNADSQIAWGAVRSYVASADYLMLIFDSNSLSGFPRDFFRSETEFNNAVAFVRAKVKPEHRTRSRRIMSLATWIVVIVLIILLWKLFQESGAQR